LKEWKTADSGSWKVLPIRIKDPKGDEWADQEWVLSKDDMLIGAHIMVPMEEAGTENGKKFFKAAEGSLTQIHWYTPLGQRGISLERFELRRFTGGFCQALESRSAAQAAAYFDDMYPAKPQWDLWYKQFMMGNPKTFDLKAELSGLVINGDYASAFFTVTRTNKDGSKPIKAEKKFRLTKREGYWKIEAPIEKN
jgi:hypothetical protein